MRTVVIIFLFQAVPAVNHQREPLVWSQSCNVFQSRWFSYSQVNVVINAMVHIPIKYFKSSNDISVDAGTFDISVMETYFCSNKNLSIQ